MRCMHRQVSAAPGNVLREIAHPLEDRRKLQHRDQQPQVLRHGLAQRDDAGGHLLYFQLLGVELLVEQDHLLGQFLVALLHALQRSGEQLLGQPTHLGNLRPDQCEVLVEGSDDMFAHSTCSQSISRSAR